MLALAVTAWAANDAWHYQDDPLRGDGNGGHCTIDFGNQYLMARMMVIGHGRQLYSRKVHREVLQEAYPRADGRTRNPDGKRAAGDAQDLLDWMLEDPIRRDLGGPLYPPVHAMLYAPLGLLRPRPAYRVLQGVIFVLVFYCGWVVQRISSGRLWWPVAATAILCLPGFPGTICLAQNPVFTLSLLLTGWWQLQEGRPFVGGLAWGFLAFKPVWVMSFGLVPLLGRRWKFLLGMGVAGAALCLASLPLVGLPSWLDWLAMGRLASEEYTRDETWIILSRDLTGLFRRWMLTFKDSFADDLQPWATDPRQVLPTILGWGLWWLVVGTTLLLAVVRRRVVRVLTGPAAAFLAFGGYFACYHFMYYDIVGGAFPLALLFAETRTWLDFSFWPRPRDPLPEPLMAYYRPTCDHPEPPPVPLLPEGRKARWVRNPLPTLLLAFFLISTPVCIAVDDSYHFPPMDTFWLLAFWVWCAAWVARRQPVSDATPAKLP
jgi:hypothetical protein